MVAEEVLLQKAFVFFSHSCLFEDETEKDGLWENGILLIYVVVRCFGLGNCVPSS